MVFYIKTSLLVKYLLRGSAPISWLWWGLQTRRYEDKSNFFHFPKHFTECPRDHDLKSCESFLKVEVSKALNNF